MSGKRRRSWCTEDRSYRLEIAASAMRSIRERARKADTHETGGILIGFYTEDCSTVVVTEATAPPVDSSSGRSWFIRGVSGLKDLFQSRWREPARSYYVGEWHYHPVAVVEPSCDDCAQMVVIAGDDRYKCHEPIMIIVGACVRSNELPLKAFVVVRRQLLALLPSDSSRDSPRPA